VKTPCLFTIQRVTEDGKRFDAAFEKCILSSQSPCHLTGPLVRPAPFSTFLFRQCLAAGCELFASVGFIIITSRRWINQSCFKQHSGDICFGNWRMTKLKGGNEKGERISSALLTGQTNPSGWSHRFWHETCLHLHFAGLGSSPSQDTWLRTLQWMLPGWSGARSRTLLSVCCSGTSSDCDHENNPSAPNRPEGPSGSW